jgi:GNAT superfamily N-acetyltransferase
MNRTPPAFRFKPAMPDDFDTLLALRIATMRPSLQRIGRYDPARAADRFRATFRPEHTRHIVVGDTDAGTAEADPAAGHHAGCVGFWREDGVPGTMRIEHFYLAAPWQGRGLGGAVLARLFAEAPDAVRFRVGALRDSDANRFYLRHGFVETGASAFDIDIDYERRAAHA